MLEVAGGVAGAYCGKLFADMGASVFRHENPESPRNPSEPLEPEAPETAGLYDAYLNAGKHSSFNLGDKPVDIVVVGEDCVRYTETSPARVASVDISWFGNDGPYARWKGSDLVVQAISGQIHPSGPIDGPPNFLGTHQSTQVGGLSAYCAALATLIGGPFSEPQHLEISILESVMIMSELQMCNSDMLGKALPRMGVNRFLPTCPLSIHRCKTGWIGITPITPAQWAAFCDMLGLSELRDDPELQAPRGRNPHAARLEAAFDTRFLEKTAEEWAALGRQHKVPMVTVPNAQGILEHPIFNARSSLATLRLQRQEFRVPLTPLRLDRTPPRSELSVSPSLVSPPSTWKEPAGEENAPLAGIEIIDFSMGWAGPLSTRMLSDFGAKVVKIEAGRYPDWWRSVDWSKEAIAAKQYETSRHFSALNRGKGSVSIDLTQSRGQALARTLVDQADVVVENQAAGVMPRLGLGFQQLTEKRDDLVMLSMSAFGSGNAWSDTRAYGSVLEQGSGLPSFAGRPDGPPTMAHIAYGDPIGGIYGAASILTALYYRRRTGRGQWINNTQIEAMLPFTSAALLAHQVTGREPVRRGNRHPWMTPHGCFPCTGEDAWVAISIEDEDAWTRLAALLGRPDWMAGALRDTSRRRMHEDEIEAAIEGWTRNIGSVDAAFLMQSQGIAAAPVHRTNEVQSDPHHVARGFFYKIERPHVGVQLQAGLPVKRDGQRYPMRGLAPFLGADSDTVLRQHVDKNGFEELLITGIVSHQPTRLRQATR